MRWLLLVFAGSAAAAACSAFKSGDTGGPVDAGDAATEAAVADDATAPAADDAAADDAAPAADGSVPPNLIINGDFQYGCGACTADNITATLVTTAHSGSTACLLCTTNDSAWGFTCSVDVAYDAGAVFLGEVWVRAPEAGDASPLSQARVDLDTADGTQGETVPGGEFVLVSSQVTAPIGADDGGGSVKLNIYGAKGCVIVDDVAIRRLE